MSQDTATVEDGESAFNCSSCGTGFASSQALGGHLSGGCPKGNGADDPEPSEVYDFSDEAAQSIIDRLNYEGKGSDSLQTIAAKALIDEGDTEGFSEAFGECDDPQCNWGANGFEADYCVKHQPEADEDNSSESDSRSESEDTGNEPGSATLNRFELGIELTQAGFSQGEAETVLDIVENNLEVE